MCRKARGRHGSVTITYTDMGVISLIHASRSRPKIAARATELWLANPGCDVEYILSLDADDPKLKEYQREKIFESGGYVHKGVNSSAVEAINKAAELATGEVIVVMSDDFIPFDNWGKAIFKCAAGHADWILKTQDGIQDWIITLPIMDQVYYQRFGYIYHPSYQHMWCDTELTCVAELTGRKLVSDMTFIHLNKPGTKIEDELSKRNDDTFENGRRIFLERKKRAFDLIGGDVQGAMTVNFYTQL